MISLLHCQQLNMLMRVIWDHFSFAEVSKDSVQKIVQNLNSSKATGLASIPTCFINDGVEFETAPLTHIIIFFPHFL